MESSMKALLSFDTFVAPKLITILYYLGLLGVVFSGISMIFTAGVYGSLLGGLVGGILTIVVGALFVRVVCEAWMVFFKMNEALQEIRNK
jgi:hypothetical protein